jgi:spore maturation protein CgeB
VKFVVFGLVVSSSWGNGHATLWRGLIGALAALGHRVIFFERDRDFYARTRDLHGLPSGCRLSIYSAFSQELPQIRSELADCEVAIVTSYCPDGELAISEVLHSAAKRSVFYDLDTPVTLERLRQGGTIEWLGRHDLRGFDLVLSFTGGASLEELRQQLGARRVRPLYGSVDPSLHRRTARQDRFSAHLSFLGTFAHDRQKKVEELFIAPARRLPKNRFLIGGAQYEGTDKWPDNVVHFSHVAPDEHAPFYSSSRLTLNLTRAAMERYGYCPSGRLFEAAACGTPIVTDSWPGLETFFTPNEEVVVVAREHEVLDVLGLSDIELLRIGQAAEERARASHTAAHRAAELLAFLAEEG